MNQEPSCIIDVFYGRTKCNSCSQKMFSVSHIIWKRLHMTNTWLFITSDPARISLDCEGRRSDIWLNVTGILQVDQGCTIDTGRKLLKTQLTRHIQGVSTFHKSLKSPPAGSWRPLDHPVYPEKEPTFKANEDFAELLHDEKLLSSNISSTTWETIHPHLTTSGISIGTTVLILLLVLVIGWYIRRRKTPTATQPSFIPARQDVEDSTV